MGRERKRTELVQHSAAIVECRHWWFDRYGLAHSMFISRLHSRAEKHRFILCYKYLLPHITLYASKSCVHCSVKYVCGLYPTPQLLENFLSFKIEREYGFIYSCPVNGCHLKEAPLNFDIYVYVLCWANL